MPSTLSTPPPFFADSRLGGIRLDGLDRLRTTLKFTIEQLSLRHSLDLYNHGQVIRHLRSHLYGRLHLVTLIAADGRPFCSRNCARSSCDSLPSLFRASNNLPLVLVTKAD